MTFTGHPYTAADDIAIQAKVAPDGVLAESIGVGVRAVRNRRRRHLRGRTVEAPRRVTDEERAKVAREEIDALQARIEETEELLCELGRMLIAARKRLVRLT
jgi:hypothetical protein